MSEKLQVVIIIAVISYFLFLFILLIRKMTSSVKIDELEGWLRYGMPLEAVNLYGLGLFLPEEEILGRVVVVSGYKKERETKDKEGVEFIYHSGGTAILTTPEYPQMGRFFQVLFHHNPTEEEVEGKSFVIAYSHSIESYYLSPLPEIV